MKKKFLVFLIFASACSLQPQACLSREVSTGAAQAPGRFSVSISEVARTIGLGREEYVYSIYWGMIRVGRATLGAKNTVLIGQATAYHIVSTARTLPAIDAVYKVRDLNESWLDVKTFVAFGFGKYLREGSFYRNETVVFDHANGKFKATVRKKNGQEVQEEGSMRPYAYDVLSALYWVRAQDFALGKEFVLDVNTRKDWPLLVRVTGQQRVKVAAGEFDCWVVEPMMRDEGIFVQKGNSMHIWMTKDPRKIPVQLKAEVFIGSVKAELEEIIYNDD